MADALYRAMGVPVPGFAVYNHVPDQLKACTGQPFVRVSRFIEANSKASNQHKAQALAQNFVADAFMSNWDIVVDGFKNVVIDQKNNLWRIDNGGSLRYRAIGDLKKGHPSWDPLTVTDLETLRDPQQNPAGARVYGQLTPDEIKAQAQRIINQAPQILQTFEEVSKVLDIHNPEELREMLARRLHDLQNRFGSVGKVNSKGPSSVFAATHEKPTLKSAAGILVYSIDLKTNEPMILLGKRIRHNWWGNLGGKSDVDPTQGPVDQTLMQTAIRETQEESQGVLKFSDFELQQSPSHDLMNSDGSLFRMYITPTDDQHPQNIPLTGKYAQEYTDFKWVPLKNIMAALDLKAPRIQEEGQETVQINLDDGPVILHAPLYRMLMEPSVQNQLKILLENPKTKLRAIRSKTGYTGQERVRWASP